MRRIVALLTLLSLLLPQGAALAQSAEGSESQSLQPGDLLEVRIWREEDLSGDFTVDINGAITLPLLGEKQVVGVPVSRLRDMLIEEYRVHLRNPSINITPRRRVNVLGEVQRPGTFSVDPTVSLAGAVALAGGTTSEGDLRRIRIVRDGAIIRERVGAGETLNTADIRSGDQIIVERRGWFDRNSTFVVSMLLSVTSIITSIIVSAQRE
jgi:polysaccharide export outer membrane protein